METSDTTAQNELGMTPEQWEAFQKYTQGFGEQDEYGVDLSLLRENLRLSPTERWNRLRKEMRFFRDARIVRRSSGN
ncbi:MAG: hypothetical protein H7145_18740 [Akkermansiaceae bacterium]|nr:hypothetical protein [Armatimonadota bacterium]